MNIVETQGWKSPQPKQEGQLFYQDGTYTEMLWISLAGTGFEYAFLIVLAMYTLHTIKFLF